MSFVLVADKSGTPKNWVSEEDACCYYARKKILWEAGSRVRTFHGGYNKKGEQSRITVNSIVGVSGPVLGEMFFTHSKRHTDREILFARDRYMCAYCGEVFNPRALTIDHVIPKSRGGQNVWTNTVAACDRCNQKKDNRTPEEAKMYLLYVPYIPNAYERLYLQNRKIISCQMEFLLNRIPKSSRVWLN